MDAGGREQRTAKRVPVNLLARLESLGSQYPVMVVDLSVGGALLDCPGFAWPPPGSALMLGLVLGEGPRLNLLARLVRPVGETGGAIAFGALDGATDRALARFVQEQERLLMKSHQHLAD